MGNSAIKFKEYDKTITVKGLSEKEFEADIVIWPIQYNVASNKLEELYGLIDANTKKIQLFLEKNGINKAEITFTPPAITDKSAQQYGNQSRPEYRYTAL